MLLNNKFDKDFYVEQSAGAAILLSRELLDQLGYLFDEKNFPLLYNDVDLSYRIKKAGYKILCKTDIKIYHLKGQSTKKVPKKSYLFIHLNSFLNYTKKHRLVFDGWITRLILFFFEIKK